MSCSNCTDYQARRLRIRFGQTKKMMDKVRLWGWVLVLPRSPSSVPPCHPLTHPCCRWSLCTCSTPRCAPPPEPSAPSWRTTRPRRASSSPSGCGTSCPQVTPCTLLSAPPPPPRASGLGAAGPGEPHELRSVPSALPADLRQIIRFVKPAPIEQELSKKQKKQQEGGRKKAAGGERVLEEQMQNMGVSSA